ncbi:YdcF family protein [Sphingomonas sp.]|uniref:YdcF family protein n=1 Tax=Sphingomonas sp. TaxID=28214 RepID=UPI001EB57A03|nr:YdcF family protein [Sphingomonas sp.]MBX3595370.1 YdcF family protein [Sphingomonas sp.]
MLSLGKPLDDSVKTDGIVVPTGGPGRIDRGLYLIDRKAAKRMLITGTDPTVRPIELAVEYKASPRLFRCCIDLGHDAVDTRSNADETAQWVRRHGFRSVRLVTADWHLPRAKLELRYELGADVEIRGDGVRTNPRFSMLLREYNKYLVRRIVLLIGGGDG